jgi:hypothetical protein
MALICKIKSEKKSRCLVRIGTIFYSGSEQYSLLSSAKLRV